MSAKDTARVYLVIPCEEHGKQAFIDVIADAIEKRSKSIKRAIENVNRTVKIISSPKDSL